MPDDRQIVVTGLLRTTSLSKGWRVVRALAFHSCNSGSMAALCHSGLTLLLAFVLLRGFPSGYSNIFNSQSNLVTGPRGNQQGLMWRHL